MTSLVSWPPLFQRVMRGKTWWGMISKTPVDWFWELGRRPLFAATVAAGSYLWFYKRPQQMEIERKFERYKQYFRADVHYQENVDWGTKEERDSMRDFLARQIQEHGSFEAAVKAYEKSTGKAAPLFVLDDPVLDYAFRRVGVPVEGPEDTPNFLWDGTPWTTRKPILAPDGKRPLPQYPTYYES